MQRKILSLILAIAMIFGVGNFIFGEQNTKNAYAVEDSEIEEATTSAVYNQNAGSITVKWDAVAGASSYQLMRAGSRLGEYSTLTTLYTTEYVDTTINADKYENYYKIIASNGIEEIATLTASVEKDIFGENMYFYDAKYDDADDVADEVNAIHDSEPGMGLYNDTYDGQFSNERFAFYLKPGDYSTATKEMRIGFYTHMGGLGKYPSDTKIRSINTPACLGGGNVTHNFWRSIENLEVARDFKWTVSQATSARRMKVDGNTSYTSTGWASGGFLVDSDLAGGGFGGQQQWYSRNNNYKSTHNGGAFNIVFQGCVGAGSSNSGTRTVIEETDVIREKPFLYMDGGEYKVFVPGIRENAVGKSWSIAEGEETMGVGTSLDLLENFYIAKPDVDNEVTINAAINAGKNIFLTPGRYYVDSPIQITRENTIVLGTGYATIIPTEENPYGAILIDDVGGVTVAGVLLDAQNDTAYLLRAGDEGADKDHSENRTLLADVFCRIGGSANKNSNADVSVQINSNDVIGDHFWLWRADHGARSGSKIGWDRNTAKNGLIVTGDNVTCYGMFVEHYLEYQTIWMGDNGKVYFYQNETPYDPPNQESWMSHDGTVRGYSAYKVANTVTTHKAVGLSMYEVLRNGGIAEQNAMEVPNKEGVVVERACIARFTGSDGILSVVNGVGGANTNGTKYVNKFVNGALENSDQMSTQPEDEEFVLPSNDRPQSSGDTTFIFLDRTYDVVVGSNCNYKLVSKNAEGENLEGVTYALKEGEVLPDGISLSEDGAISGSINKTGTYRFVVIASKEGLPDKEATIMIVVKTEPKKSDTDKGCGSTSTSGLPIAMLFVLFGTCSIYAMNRKKERV